MKRLLPFLLIPIFATYGPNLVGYSTIIDTSLDDMNIETGSVMTCSVVLNVDNGGPTVDMNRHITVEGLLLLKEPFTLLFKSEVGSLPLTLKDDRVEFCVMSASQMD